VSLSCASCLCSFCKVEKYIRPKDYPNKSSLKLLPLCISRRFKDTITQRQQALFALDNAPSTYIIYILDAGSELPKVGITHKLCAFLFDGLSSTLAYTRSETQGGRMRAMIGARALADVPGKQTQPPRKWYSCAARIELRNTAARHKLENAHAALQVPTLLPVLWRAAEAARVWRTLFHLKISYAVCLIAKLPQPCCCQETISISIVHLVSVNVSLRIFGHCWILYCFQSCTLTFMYFKFSTLTTFKFLLVLDDVGDFSIWFNYSVSPW